MPGTKRKLTQRNTAIMKRFSAGDTVASIARHFTITPERVRQIVYRLSRRDAEQSKLQKQYGEKPSIATLPDETPIEVLVLLPTKVHGWAVRLRQLQYWEPPITTLGDLRSMTNAQLFRIPNVGRTFVKEIRRHCPERD